MQIEQVTSQLVVESEVATWPPAAAKAVGVLQNVQYKPSAIWNGQPLYWLRLVITSDDRPYIQVACVRPDIVTGCYGEGRGGKAYLSPFMSRSEIVQTAFGLYKAFEEHEAREGFSYCGRRIYGPHIDVAALMAAAMHLEVRSIPKHPTPSSSTGEGLAVVPTNSDSATDFHQDHLLDHPQREGRSA